MPDFYQARLYTPNGRFVRLIDNYAALSVARKQNAVGSATLTMFDSSLPIEPHSILLIERSVNGAPPKLFGETIFFIEKINYNSEGISYTGYDANYLLNWRIVAANSGTPYADKELPADDYIKALAREAFGTLALDQRRTWPIIIEADKSLAPVIKQESARDKLINVYQTLTQASSEKGTPLFFDIIAGYDFHGNITLTLRTYVNQRGINRETLTLSHEHLFDLELEIDNSETPTVIYSGGKGRGTSREVQLVYSDDALSGKYAWREAWVADKDLSTTQALIDEGYSQLKAKQQKITLSAKLVSSPEMAFGQHFNFGDIVTANAYGYNIPCSIDEFEINVREGKAETNINLSGAINNGATQQGNASTFEEIEMTTLTDHINNFNNPHRVTAAQVGNWISQWNANKINSAPVPALSAGVLTSDGTSLTWEVPTLTKVAVVYDQKAQGTAGGTFTSGAWRQRDLNAESDPDNLVSVSANSVTILQSGTYLIRASAPAYNTNKHKIRLLVNGAEVCMGTNEFSGANTIQSRSFLSIQLYIASTSVITLEHNAQTTSNTSGLGVSSGISSAVEIYSVMEIIKLS